MFSRTDLETLAAYSGSHPVVSLYLNMDPTRRGSPDLMRTRLKNLLKEAALHAPQPDVEAIESYFTRVFDWTGQSVAVFSCVADYFWQVEQFTVPMRSAISVGDKPFIVPLVGLMDAYGSYAVALVDQQAMRMFYVHLGEVVAYEKAEGDEVQRVKSGGGSAGRARGGEMDSRTQEMVRGNFRTFGEDLGVFCNRFRVEHILLGGTEPTLHMFKDLMGNQLRERVQGMFNISMRAPESEMLEKSLDLIRGREEAREKKLVEQIQALAARGANGVVGLENTLPTIEAGRVQTLVLVEGALPSEQADQAILKVVDYGGTVQFVDEESALKEDKIGALLRY